MKDLTITLLDDRLFVSTLEIAPRCQVQHESVIALLDQHSVRFEKYFEIIRFEIGKLDAGRGRPSRWAFLTEDQASFLITLLRNTDPVIEFKAALVVAFREARNQLAALAKPGEEEENAWILERLRHTSVRQFAEELGMGFDEMRAFGNEVNAAARSLRESPAPKTLGDGSSVGLWRRGFLTEVYNHFTSPSEQRFKPFRAPRRLKRLKMEGGR